MNELKSTVSIVIPVYNAENFIKDCLDSILSQTYKDFEVILINDGSTDSSEKIIEEYIKKDDRICLINQENQGAPKARNLGIKKSKGKYIMFFDADDILKQNSLEILVSSISSNNASLVIR